MVITVYSPERVSDALSTLEGADHTEACASLEDGVLDRGPLDADRAMRKVPLKIATKLSFSA